VPGIILLLALLQQAPAMKVGDVLVATQKSHDPDLAKSVVVVIHADADGVMGLILNRPRGESTYFGGPIPLGVRALFRSRTKPENAEHIIGEVYLMSKVIPKGARVYAGYVGWSAQQLSDEISRGLWKHAAGSAALIFDPHPETLWQRRQIISVPRPFANPPGISYNPDT
jgi:putative transcriptional regulator